MTKISAGARSQNEHHPLAHAYVRLSRADDREEAQHLQRERVAPNLFHADEVVYTEQDNERAQHEIACAVEDLIT